MKKLHKHTDLSDRTCSAPGCLKRIKARMHQTNDAHLCYGHWCKKEAARGHTVNTQARKKRIIQELPVKNFNKNLDI